MKECFNEAGAGCPGIRAADGCSAQRSWAASMRPGQAAPVFGLARRGDRPRRTASMRPGQAAPVFRGGGLVAPAETPASMRPGQSAPVFAVPFCLHALPSGGFNEAGAGCPGIHAFNLLTEPEWEGLQ